MRKVETIRISVLFGVNSIVCNHFDESKAVGAKNSSFGEPLALKQYNLRQSGARFKVSSGLRSRKIAAFAIKPLCQTCLRRSVPRLIPPLLTIRVWESVL